MELEMFMQEIQQLVSTGLSVMTYGIYQMYVLYYIVNLLDQAHLT